MNNKNLTNPESTFYDDIRAILVEARKKTYSAINKAMVDAYWKIGKRIVEQEQHGNKKAVYGEGLLKKLSKELSGEFGKGFSYANLRNFRQFYLTYPEHENCYALRSNLSWTHHRIIMRIENGDERNYYINECEEQNWSTRILKRNIDSKYYNRLLSTKSELIKPVKNYDKPEKEDFIKDPYILEFLGMPENTNYLESSLEKAIINNLQKFLLELGKGFSFVGRQFRISTETTHFYLDLVFYNYLLKCFVVIDLKTGKLTHQE